MPTTQATELVKVVVSLVNGEPAFNYLNSEGQQYDGDVTVTQAETITYQLIDDTGRGLKFAGAGFLTPFDGVIDSIEVSPDGMQLQMIDTDQTPGTTKFQFILTNSSNNLFLISPDPQVVNEPK